MKRNPGNPSSVFYWKDYENDEGLRVSSLAAQGLWMRLLCVAAKAEPFGYVLVNGHALDATAIARLSGAEATEVAALIAELERNGVFSRDRKGRIYSRRMVKEAATSAKNRKNGEKGGNPALRTSEGKETTKQGSDNRNPNPSDKPPLPYSHSHKKETPDGVSGARDIAPYQHDARAISAEFDRIWPHYPKKAGKAEARKAWGKARKVATYDAIAGPLRAYVGAVSTTDLKFVKNLATWLNQQCWEDDDQSHAANRPRTSTEDLAAISTLTSTDDLTRLFGHQKPQLKVIGS